MIRHIIDRNQLLILNRDNARDVLLEFLVVFPFYQVLPAFDREDHVNIDLRVGIGHALKMPLLRELEKSFCMSSTRMSHLRCFFMIAGWG
jgi:hypothetical protein